MKAEQQTSSVSSTLKILAMARSPAVILEAKVVLPLRSFSRYKSCTGIFSLKILSMASFRELE